MGKSIAERLGPLRLSLEQISVPTVRASSTSTANANQNEGATNDYIAVLTPEAHIPACRLGVLWLSLGHKHGLRRMEKLNAHILVRTPRHAASVPYTAVC
jgi:hypothetical protein